MKNIIKGLKRTVVAALAVAICASSMLTARAATTGTWTQDAVGWWYQNADGSYPVNKWSTIDGTKYYFNASGYAATGWQQIGGKWYLFDKSSCALLTGWQLVDGEWYYMHSSGEMLTGWQKTSTGWSYLDTSGKWISNTSYDSKFTYGIDVSKWQGEIDWQAVKNEGVQFAFVRIGHGNHILDPYFDANMKGAEKVGIPTGVYYYSEATSETQALRDAQFVIDKLDGYLVSYPVVIDVEDAVQASLSKEQLGNLVKTFCDEIASAGYTPMLYCNENWYKNHIDVSLIPNVAKWIARYNAVYDADIKRDIWQAGSTTRINGIKGNVDIDFGFVDYTKKITPRRSKASSYLRQNGAWRIEDKGKWYEFTDGGWAVGWELIGKDWYYFDEEGWLKTGWLDDGGKRYYLNSKGTKTIGWATIEENKYYFNANGEMQTGWLKIDKSEYCFDKSGKMLTGWVEKDGKWYFMQEDGKWTKHIKNNVDDPLLHEIVFAKTKAPTCTEIGLSEHYECKVCGWMFSDELGENRLALADVAINMLPHTLTHVTAKDASCTASGNKLHDKCTVCQKLFVDSKEVTSKDITLPIVHKDVNVSGVAAQLGKSGIKAHQKCTICGKCFLNGKEVAPSSLVIKGLEAWQSNSIGWWYVNSDGSYAHGLKKIDNNWYYFDAEGYMQTGWIQNGGWRYFGSDGAMQTGWMYDGVWYYFNNDGIMATGWAKDSNNDWYYFDGSGAMQTGWLLDGAWYYLNASGTMQTGWFFDGAWYYFNDDGTMQTGWLLDKGVWYWLDSSGAWIA